MSIVYLSKNRNEGLFAGAFNSKLLMCCFKFVLLEKFRFALDSRGLEMCLHSKPHMIDGNTI